MTSVEEIRFGRSEETVVKLSVVFATNTSPMLMFRQTYCCGK